MEIEAGKTAMSWLNGSLVEYKKSWAKNGGYKINKEINFIASIMKLN